MKGFARLLSNCKSNAIVIVLLTISRVVLAQSGQFDPVEAFSPQTWIFEQVSSESSHHEERGSCGRSSYDTFSNQTEKGRVYRDMNDAALWHADFIKNGPYATTYTNVARLVGGDVVCDTWTETYDVHDYTASISQLKPLLSHEGGSEWFLNLPNWGGGTVHFDAIPGAITSYDVNSPFTFCGMSSSSITVHFELVNGKPRITVEETTSIVTLPNCRESGLWYSKVVLEPVRIQFIDPRKEISIDNDLYSKVEKWAVSSDIVKGVIADNVTRIIVRIPVSDEISGANLSLEDEGGLTFGVGSLSNLSQTVFGNAVQLAPAITTNGKCIFAVYKAPDEFVRHITDPIPISTQDESKTERWVYVKAALSLASGGTVPMKDSIKIVRPPVVLLHGIWSSAGDAFKPSYETILKDGGKRVVHSEDYKDFNQLEFSRNIVRPRDGIKKVLTELRENGIAATKADVVAHSMGGLLTRLYVQNEALYKRPDNFLEGDVNRIVTIDSPHFGTPIADLVTRMTDICEGAYDFDCTSASDLFPPDLSAKEFACRFLQYIACQRLGKKSDAFTGGAVADLRSGGPRIKAFETTQVPCHALTGDASASFIPIWLEMAALIYPIPQLYKDITGNSFANSMDELYCDNGHDYLVDLSSQRGGLGFGQVTPLSGAFHTQATNADYADEVLQILRESKNSTVWGNFTEFTPGLPCLPPPYVPASPAGAPKQMATSSNALSTTEIVILSPTPNTPVVPGEIVTIQLQVTTSESPVEVVVLGDGIAKRFVSEPYTVEWQIPPDAIDGVEFIVYAANDSSFLAFHNPVILPVNLVELPSALSISPRYMPLSGPGAGGQIRTTGIYTNDVSRDLTSPTRGTHYSSADPAIAEVTSTGLVIAKSMGKVQVTATNGSLSAVGNIIVETNVPVLTDTTPPVINFGNSCPDTVVLGSTTFLNVQVTDDQSGIATQSVPNGQVLIEASTGGSHSITVAATDNSGNSASQTCTYFVKVPAVKAENIVILPSTWYTSWSSSSLGTIRAYIGDLSNGYSVSNLVPSSILLGGVVPIFNGISRVRPSMTGFTGPVLEVAFSRQLAVQSLGQSPVPGSHSVTISGQFSDGRRMEGVITIVVVLGKEKAENVLDGRGIPTEFSLADAHPNPFNPNTTIAFGLPQQAHVQIEVINMLGQKVRTLADGEFVAGSHSVNWDGTSDTGVPVASGVYLYRIKAGEFTETKKMVLMK